MKVSNKFRINNKFLASLEIVSEDENLDEFERVKLVKALKFIQDVKDRDLKTLTSSQIKWIADIRLDLIHRGVI